MPIQNVANSYYENITKQMFFYNTTKYYLEKYHKSYFSI